MVPGARLQQIPESRAFVPEDQPELLAELIDAFVKERLPVGTPAEPEATGGKQM